MMNGDRTGKGDGSYRVIDHEGFAEVEILTPILPEQIAERLIREANERRWTCVLLECSKVQFVSSLSLGGLLRLDRHLRPLGGRLRLCGLEPSLVELLKITHLDRVLQVCEDREAGIARGW